MNDTNSPFALNLDNLKTEEQETTEIVKNTEQDEKPIVLDLPTSNIEEPAFETVEIKKKPKISVEEQAKALLRNYETMHPNTFLSGTQRRTLYRQFLRNAQKGKYEKIFNS